MKKSIKTKKKKSYRNAKLILLFSITFVLALFLISTFIKNYSPTIDVNIGGEEISQIEDDVEDDIGKGIDDRLKWIQFEDNMTESPVVNEIQNLNDDEEKFVKTVEKTTSNAKKISKIKQDIKTTPNNNSKNNQNKDIPQKVIEKKELATVPVKYHLQTQENTIEQTKKTQPTATPTKMTKVYVGYYTTQEEANEVKNELMSAVSGYQPYVKKINNNYIVQIGSFSDRIKAVNLKLDLSDKGYPARLLTE